MPHNPTKKQRIEGHQSAAADDDFVASFDDLGVDVVANVFAFLTVEEIMPKRRINKKSREAVKMTTPLPSYFSVHNMRTYNALNVMATELPNLQQIKLVSLVGRHKYNDGEDPDEERAAYTANWPTYDIEIISNFRKLSILEINSAGLNGRYSFLFNSFPLLQKLSIKCNYLKWDLDMLAGFPMLKELHCEYNDHLTDICYNRCLTGNINSLRVLKDTLEKVEIKSCWNVEGNFMDLADFPHLKQLDLYRTAVTGDIRDIGSDDFSSLERLHLPKGVYGGCFYELQRISAGHDLMRAVYTFNKQRPSLKIYNWYGILSRDSPDWYESVGGFYFSTPFYICFVEAGSRIGYRWDAGNNGQNPCEVNWLDPQPDRESSDYEEYIVQLEKIQDEIGMYRGFHQPPTEEEYIRLVEG